MGGNIEQTEEGGGRVRCVCVWVGGGFAWPKQRVTRSVRGQGEKVREVNPERVGGGGGRGLLGALV